MTTELAVAILGCGRIASAHAEAINATSGVRLVAVCDVGEAAAQQMAARYGVASFTHHETLLSACAPAIVIICTPPSSHSLLACDCLAAGAHVLCEKPLSIAPDEVKTMFEAAQRQRRALMMAAKFRFVPAVREAKERIARGELGNLVFYRNTFVAPVEMQGRMNAERALSGGGVLMDNGPHAFDLSRFLLGSPLNLQAHFAANQQNLEVEDNALIRFQTENWPQVQGEIFLSWSAHAPSPYFVEIAGTKSALAIGWSDYDKSRAFAAQMQHFVEVVHGKAAPEVSREDALWNAQIIAECYEKVRKEKASQKTSERKNKL